MEPLGHGRRGIPDGDEGDLVELLLTEEEVPDAEHALLPLDRAADEQIGVRALHRLLEDLGDLPSPLGGRPGV